MTNVVVLDGRLTATPELKTTGSGTSVTTVTMAVERRFKSKDGEKITDFINCVAWRNTAEFITHYFKKGDPIAITGEIQTRKYKDKQGNNRVAVEVVITDARFVPSSKTDNGNNDESNYSAPPANDAFVEMPLDEDLPF